MPEPVLRVIFGDPDNLLEQQSHVADGGLFLPVPDPAPEPLTALLVQLVLPGIKQIELTAQVVQVIPGRGFACTVDNAGRGELETLFEAAVEAEATVGDTVVLWLGDDDDVDGFLSEDAADVDGDGEVDQEEKGTLFDQIKAMSATKKMQLARHGDRAARLLLMKDPNKTIHTFLVQNKKITLDEIRYLAGFRQANPQALKMIADNRIWMQNARIVAALVRNPKTPAPIAVKLLDKLPMPDLRRLARSSDVPPAVSRAAKRKVIK